MARQRGRRGEGTIIKNGDGTFTVKVWVGGKRIERKRRTLREAQVVKRELLEMTTPPQRKTVESWLEQWLEQGRRDWAPGTYALRRQRVTAYFTPQIGRHQLADLAAVHVQRVQETLLKTLAPSTVANVMGALSAALSEAERMGLVEENVARRVRKPRQSRRRMVSLPAADLAAVLAAVEGHWVEPIAACGLLCLMRISEVLGLRWQDVDLESGVIHVRGQLLRQKGVSVWRETKTAKSERLVGMPPRVMRLLEARRIVHVEERLRARTWQVSDFIFTNRHGDTLHPSTVRTAWKNRLEAKGLKPMRFHDLRHAGTSHLLEQGEQVRVVMEVLGHSDPRLTMGVYAHVHAEQMKQAASRIDRALGG